MKSQTFKHIPKLPVAILAFSLCAVGAAMADNVSWIAVTGVSATTNWSDANNWIHNGTTTHEGPANNEANFNMTAADVNGKFINVDAPVPGQSLSGANSSSPQAWGMYFTQTNGTQTVFIQPGVMLCLQAANGGTGGGNVAIDPGTTNNGGSSQGVVVSTGPYTNDTIFTGIGGTFYANTGTMRIEAQSSTVMNHYTIWDMSGLGTYIFTNTANSSMNIYCSDGQTRGNVIIYLAHTNLITMNGGGQIHICNESSTSSNSQPTGIYLGQTNYIITGSSSSNLLIGGFGCAAGAFLQFNPALLGGASMPSAYISGVNGAQNAAICSTVGGATGGTATANFNGGNVTWIGSTLAIGVSGSSTGNITANGTLSFDNGLVNFNNVLVGVQSASSGAAALGTVNIGTNAVLQVNTLLTLGATTGTANAGTSGTINVNTNGVLKANVITSGAAGSAVNMTNATWSVALASTATTNMIVANFNSGGSTNIVNITSITPFLNGSPPLRFHLIASANIIGASTNLGVMLPTTYNPSYPYAGYLDFSTTPGVIDFVLTAAPPSARSLTWTGTNGGGGTNVLGGADADWDVATTADWQTNNVATLYNQYDLATFTNIPATAASNVNLTTTITPYSVTVSNTTTLYTIGGSGNLSGTMSLTKAGAGTLILDNQSPNNFTGGVTISGGVLQIGTNDNNGNLPALNVTDNGVLAFDQTQNASFGNVISGSGTVIVGGGSTLTLSAANSFTGPAIATNDSTLQGGVAGAFGASSGSVIVANGSTLDPNGVGTTRSVTVSGTGVNGNGAITDSGGMIPDSAGGLTPTLTLAGDTTLSYPVRWDLGSSTGATLSTGGQPYNLTLSGGTNYFEWRDVRADASLANITVTSGYLGIAGSTSVGSATNGWLTIASGAGMKFYNDDGFNVSITKQVALQDSGLLQNGGGNNTLSGTLDITNANGGEYCQFQIGGTLTINSTLTGDGILWMQGSTGLLTLNGNGSGFTGGVLVPPGAGSLTINGTLGCAVTNQSSTVLNGSGSIAGVLDVGGNFYPGGNGTAGTFTTGGLTLEGSGSLTMDLAANTTVGSGVNDLIVVNGDLNPQGANITINPIGGTLANGTYVLMEFTGALNGSFGGAQTVASSRYMLNLNTTTGLPTNQVQLSVTGTPNNLLWNNDGNNAQWDVQSSYNWTNLTTHVEDQFYTSDAVTFDDTISQSPSPATTINVGVNVSPSVMTVNATSNSYTFVGPSAISGGASIVKQGSSTLTIDTTNSFTGNVTISGGTLLTGNNSSLGSAIGTVYVTNGATLDLGYSLLTKPLVISGAGVNGQGALINSIGGPVYDNPGGLRNVTLAGNATIGGPNRIDFGQTAPATGTVSSGGNNYNLTVVGTTYREWDNVTFDANFGDIYVMTTNGGTVGIKGTTTLGNTNNTLAVFSNAIVVLYEDSTSLANVTLNKNIMLYGGSIFQNGGGTNVVLGPITLGTSAADICVFNVGGNFLTVSNVISGPGSLVKSNSASPLILTAANIYTGSTVVLAGPLDLVGGGSINSSTNIVVASGQTLDVTKTTLQLLDLNSGQTLQGSGTINGGLDALAGSILNPGTNGSGTLTVSSNVTLQGTTEMTVTSGGASTELSGSTIAYGGALNLTVSGTLSVTNKFKLFNSTAGTPTYTGSFTSITPATPGPGLQWDTSQLNSTGTLQVSLNPTTFGPSSISGTNLTFTGSGGTSGGTYYILTATNVRGPWTTNGSGTFDTNGNFVYMTNISTNLPTEFFQMKP